MFSINGYPIDVIKQYRPHHSSTTTKHPVEKGSQFTNNILANPYEFTIDAVISNTPVGQVAQDATRQGTSPAKDAWDNFVAVKEARQPITVVMPDGTYTNMALIDIVRTMDPSTGDALVFTAAFEKIVIVTNNRTTIRSSIAGGGGQNHKGDRQAITLDPSSTWVVSYPASDEYRKRATKIYGPPIVKGKDGGNAFVKGKNGQLEPNVNTGVATLNGATPVNVTGYDRYKVDPNKVTPDGYVDKAGNYTPYSFDPASGKYHTKDALFNGPNDNPLNMTRQSDSTRIEHPNNINDYLKNQPPAPPAQPAPKNQPQTAAPGSLASALGR